MLACHRPCRECHSWTKQIRILFYFMNHTPYWEKENKTVGTFYNSKPAYCHSIWWWSIFQYKNITCENRVVCLDAEGHILNPCSDEKHQTVTRKEGNIYPNPWIHRIYGPNKVELDKSHEGGINNRIIVEEARVHLETARHHPASCQNTKE
jgi:hypothetical protein